MIIEPIARFIHPLHLSGFGDDARMTSSARHLKAVHGWRTLSLLSVRAQHFASRLSWIETGRTAAPCLSKMK
jgi:hypothetical protein